MGSRILVLVHPTVMCTGFASSRELVPPRRRHRKSFHSLLSKKICKLGVLGANDNREPTKQPILGVMNGLNSYAWVTSFLEHKALTPIGMIQPKK